MIELQESDFPICPGRPWVLPATSHERAVLQAICRRSVPLGDIAEVRNGIQTSANRIFVIRDFRRLKHGIEFAQAGITWTIEAAAARPYLDDSSRLTTFHELRADAVVVFPYQTATSPRNVSGVEIIPCDQMQEEFPGTYRYLMHHAETLARRDRVDDGAPFYAFGRTQALGYVFDYPKIVYSVNQRGDKYGVDTSGIAFASGGTAGEVGLYLASQDYEIDFVLGLLSQSPIEFFLRKRGSPFRGGYYSRGSDVIADVPVPHLDWMNDSHRTFSEEVISHVREIREQVRLLTVATPRSEEQGRQRMTRLRAALALLFAEFWGLDPSGYHRLGPGLGGDQVR